MPRFFASCRRGAVSVIFAIATIPILGFCGLAVDYGVWSEVNANLETAVNVAALNAVKIAANGYINHDSNYVAEGQAAGSAWFYAIEKSMRPQTNGGTINIAITGNTSITATATYSGASIPRIIGKIFGTKAYFFNVQAAATINTASYLEVVMMLDNSSSMDIAATVSGINQLMTLSACDPTNAYYPSPALNTASPAENFWTNASLTPYDVYQTSYGGVTFNGSYVGGVPNDITLSPPVADPILLSPFPAATANEYPTGTLVNTNNQTTFTPEPYQQTANYPYHANATSWNTKQSCKGVLPAVNGQYPLPGPPCAFACHWTNQPVQAPPGATTADPRGGTNDLYGLARRNGIPLRFDYVKQATQDTLQQMQKDNNTALNNLSVGIYTFNSTLTQVYPTNAEAGSDFVTAEAKVGTPPTLPATADTGIQPVLGGLSGDNYDTAFPEEMTTLANQYVTPAGDGTTAAAPRKALFLITDGFEDDPYAPRYPTPAARQPFETSYCQLFKNMGYQVYVVYTPYYPVPHQTYLANDWAQYVQSNSASNSIPGNLQACSSQSSDPNGIYYVSALDQKSLSNALLAFLQQALKSPARYTE